MGVKNNDLSLIVYSCYKNRDMWDYFSFFFRNYYPDCEFEIVLVTDSYRKKEGHVFDRIVIMDDCWSNMIKRAIIESGKPYVMLFMDDYLINAKVDNSTIENIIVDIKKYDAVNIRMIDVPFSSYENFDKSEKYRRIVPGSAYSLCTQPGIWKSDYFINSIDDGISAWYFERNCSIDVKNDNLLILECLDYRFPYVEGVRKGRWMTEGIELLEKHNIKPDYVIRKKMSNFDNLIKYIKGKILLLAPDEIQILQNMINKSRNQK